MSIISNYFEKRKERKEFGEARKNDPYYSERTFANYIKLAEQYPEAADGYIKCGICGDDISLYRMMGCKFDANRDHPIYYICEDCVMEGEIGPILVPIKSGNWMEIDLTGLSPEQIAKFNQIVRGRELKSTEAHAALGSQV